MEKILEFVKPELLVLVPALYFLGWIIKKSEKVPDAVIPFVLGVAGLVLAGMWVLATSAIATWQDALLAIFTAIVQGLICAGLSVYANQLFKQGRELRKEHEAEEPKET